MVGNQFLEQTAYPMMKEAALFWMDYLIEDENGHLVSSPSYSPEHGGISSGASMDHQIAWDILNNCIEATKVLGTDEKFREEAQTVRDRIFPPTLGSWGQLQEWKEDVDDSTNKHRHVSHLYALHPGKQISIEKTPQLAEAAKVIAIKKGIGLSSRLFAVAIAIGASKAADALFDMISVSSDVIR